MLRNLLLISLFLVAGALLVFQFETPSTFLSPGSRPSLRLHTSVEPHSLDPLLGTAGDVRAIFHNLFRGLYSYSDTLGLQPAGAKSCRWKTPRELHCELKPDLRWSDGSTVVAQDYLRTFQQIVSPGSKGRLIEYLEFIENARAIWQSQMAIEQLGISAPDEQTLVFKFTQPEPEFLYKLADSFLTPRKSSEFPPAKNAASLITNGPYQIAQWIPGQTLELTPNRQYPGAGNNPPDVFFYFVEDDKTALNLYKSGKLNFLRRIPTEMFQAYRSEPEFKTALTSRFDYFGFGSELMANEHARRALIHAIDYNLMQNVHESPGRYGCPGIDEKWMSREPCYHYDPDLARREWAKVPEDLRKKPRVILFSLLFGDDNQRTGEFMQNQWKNTLGVQFEIELRESGIFFDRIRNNPPDVFRKGVALDRPTCLAALEVFGSDSAENYIRLKSPEFDQILARFAQVELQTGLPAPGEAWPSSLRELCTQGIEFLLKRNLLIPTGRWFLAYLVKEEVEGWELNQLGQLDLSRVRIRP